MSFPISNAEIAVPQRPRIRTVPEDFQVEELPLDPPSGDGAFLWLWIEKRLTNTDDVARTLAKQLDLRPRDVAYAGRKDHRAVTRQWFSVPAACEPGVAGLELDGAKVLDHRRSAEGLGVGRLGGNRFLLRVRGVDPETAERVRFRLDDMARRGMPNRYGKQRFGRDGRNAERGRQILTGERRRGEPRTGWLMVSALQSAVFNGVLDHRLETLDEIWPGDVAMVHATGEFRWVNDVDADRPLAERFAISATGPIFGTKMKRPRGRAAELESLVMAEYGLPPVAKLKPPKGVRMYGARRSLRVQPSNASCRYLRGEGALDLAFDLPAGSYATIFLDELLPAGYEEGPAETPRS
ncbi:MAG: tRNA pseudouridine(13) synthase TruD [Acidobacteriota bacterium]